ncbi:unnamed protein product [Moneuplotes crassus]|uniref:Histidine kinase domain-containing protein n=1 Tax=Euplotes crassus TaxID=5936 RepID=A0AAD1Y9D5_EUPCR|nr:unnamed protein product [Moneuplotes crassus]
MGRAEEEGIGNEGDGEEGIGRFMRMGNGGDEDGEVKRFMNEKIQESLQKSYSRYIRIGCLGNMVVCFVAALTAVLTMNEENEKANTQLCTHSVTFLVISFLILVICGRKAFYLVYLVPILLGLGIYMAIDITLQSEEYRPSEYIIVSSCVAHCLMILIPNKWIHSSIAHALAMGYLGYGAWKTYGLVSSDINLTIMLCVFWFTLSSYFLSLKTTGMYAEIYKNKKLIEEMKKVLQILPFGVVIWPSKAGEKYFANKEFRQKYTEVDHSLEELAGIELKLLDDERKAINEEFRNDLAKFLKTQQRLIESNECIVEQNVEVKCFPKEAFQMSEDSDGAVNQKNCCIKTLNIEWEGVNSHLHVFIDNTNVIRLEKMKNKMKLEEADNNMKLQKIMFASASHEFRTPLNSITNSFDIILNSFNTINRVCQPYFSELEGLEFEEIDLNVETLMKFIKIGKSSSLLLLTLIEDVLNLSKMEAGTFTINKEIFKVPEILDEIYDIFSMQCEQKNIKLSVRMSNDVRKLNIFSDKSRIKQIIMNLVSNSMKFTFKGSITIECMNIWQRGRVFTKFSVRDTGVGIKKKDQKKLFKLFGMISKTKSMNKSGTGIGLTISKKYVEAIGGEIYLKSAPRVGTEVTFTVPVDRIPESESHPQSSKSIWSYFESDFEIAEEGRIHQNLAIRKDIGSRGCFTKR